MIKKSILILVIALSTSILSFSQSVINSPYTRFGIGEINRNGFNNSKAMGGISTGLRKVNQINYMNPAAISSQDSMSFILDIGVNVISNELKTTEDQLTYNNGSFDHIAIAFPIKRWWYASISLNPYSKIGYNITQSEAHPYLTETETVKNYLGDGGINQFTISNSFKIGQHLSFGFNYNYLFGSIEQYNQTYISDVNSYSTVQYDKYTMNKSNLDLGVQYYTDIKDKYFVVAGVSYSTQVNFKAKNNTAELTTGNYINAGLSIIDYLALGGSIDTITSSVDENYEIEVPARYSVGFSGGIKNKLTVGFDFSYQDWSDVKTIDVTNNYTSDQTVNFGIEYIPNFYDLRSYLKKINYRAGAFYNNSYIQINDEQINNYGITFGLGFPIANQRTSINVSYTYGKRGNVDNGLIEETYSMIGLNLTLYDFWFIKRKFQ
ncbi:MAG: hypothetical protein JEY96_17100 [Bacteroidales bacterium]|nr:hypothetical protein [Bacteroidales bacterium]